MISTSDFRTGMTIEVDGELMSIVEFQHVKTGRGGAFVRTKLRNLKTGQVFDKTFRSGEKFQRVYLESREMQYLYNTGEMYIFMDTESYEQLEVAEEVLGDRARYLTDNLKLNVVFHNGQIVDIELPTTVELEVTETDPGLKGDTASGGSKPATVQTGLVVQVPLFINIGDRIRVDTRTGEYVTRA